MCNICELHNLCKILFIFNSKVSTILSQRVNLLSETAINTLSPDKELPFHQCLNKDLGQLKIYLDKMKRKILNRLLSITGHFKKILKVFFNMDLFYLLISINLRRPGLYFTSDIDKALQYCDIENDNK